ncbi:hypothetical protein F5148DRAFT_1266602 [Russula earlei]|uniref:Uncharacterized protein n=1 Tax=Russula earlei TaxID=71964 RepID=A0ACC0TRF5_9AGAM|nr:hypothetical protein F5148DRAFT_1266602 [Russula earlei]
MDRLADEVLQLIFNEIDHPSSFVRACRRFNSFSRDPYVRAHYFLSRYGPVEAMYWALGGGPLINEHVLDVLLSSGAHLSRYLVQVAVHHYFRSLCPFIKTPWVRTLSLSTFGHFLKLSSERFGAINIAKGEDDGAVFRSFIRESRRRPDRRGQSTDAIAEILEKGKFIPFCSKDPIMAQFPLALSIEPRLLPLAIANGFRMDGRYRDFVFRRIFARDQERGVQDILLSVRELCRLDPSMFISRTVAAEVLMEAESNRTGYATLKTLDREGDLRFSLGALVEDLVKSFIKAHSITAASTGASLCYLWKDFPSRNPIARLVMLLTVFISYPGATPDTLHLNLEHLNLTPVSSEQIGQVLLSPFVEQFPSVLRYARVHCEIDDATFPSFLAGVAVGCLEVASKGNMLHSMCKKWPSLTEDIEFAVVTKYRLTVEDLPSPDQRRRALFPSKLCRDICAFNLEASVATREFDDDEWEGSPSNGNELGVRSMSEQFLGAIGQETLTQVIARDELDPRRRRAPWLSNRINWNWPLKPPFPADVLPVGKWILSQFGRRHLVTAIFMDHAVVNDNYGILRHYLSDCPSVRPIVPVTLHHFKMLAHLGRAPHYLLFDAIKDGASFFFSDNDYLSYPDDVEVKRETPCAEIVPSWVVKDPSPSIEPTSGPSLTSIAAPTRKRLQRSAATTVKSYAFGHSDSDDDHENLSHTTSDPSATTTRPVESNLQLWIRHLSALQKAETKKFNEKKRRLEQSSHSGPRPRVARSDFLKTLTTGLRELRQLESTKKQQAPIPAVLDDRSVSDDEEYQSPKRPSKRRKVPF